MKQEHRNLIVTACTMMLLYTTLPQQQAIPTTKATNSALLFSQCAVMGARLGHVSIKPISHYTPLAYSEGSVQQHGERQTGGGGGVVGLD